LAATYAYANPNIDIHTLIAIPYNPYHPKPYERWTMAGMLDLDSEIKVAERSFGIFRRRWKLWDDFRGVFGGWDTNER